jgi:hypothetical protein
MKCNYNHAIGSASMVNEYRALQLRDSLT